MATGHEPEEPGTRARSKRAVCWATTAAEVGEISSDSRDNSSTNSSAPRSRDLSRERSASQSPRSSRSSSRTTSPRSSRNSSRNSSRAQSPMAVGFADDDDEAGSGDGSINGDGGDGGSDGGGGGGSGGGNVGGGGEPSVVDALLAHVQAAACCSLVVDTTVSVEALRSAVRDALAEAGCGPPDQPAAHVRASLPPHRLRLCQRVASARTGAVMRDGRAAVDYIFGAAADQSLAVQLLAVEERLEGGTLLLGYLLLDAAGCAMPAAALHVQAPRWVEA